MGVGFILELGVKLKKMVFNIQRKFLDLKFFGLAALKLLPRQK